MIIYKTTNLVNGKFYIGKDTKNCKTYLGSGKLLQKALKKYGRSNFTKETLQVCSTLDELNKAEVYWIRLLNARNKTLAYNIAEGGDGGNLRTGIVPWNSGKTGIYSENTLIKMRRPKSDEYKRKMREYIKTKEHCLNISKSKIGKAQPTKWKCVFQYSQDNKLLRMFHTVTEAADSLGISRSNIKKCTDGKIKHCGGYKWSYSLLMSEYAKNI